MLLVFHHLLQLFLLFFIIFLFLDGNFLNLRYPRDNIPIFMHFLLFITFLNILADLWNFHPLFILDSLLLDSFLILKGFSLELLNFFKFLLFSFHFLSPQSFLLVLFSKRKCLLNPWEALFNLALELLRCHVPQSLHLLALWVSFLGGGIRFVILFNILRLFMGVFFLWSYVLFILFSILFDYFLIKIYSLFHLLFIFCGFVYGLFIFFDIFFHSIILIQDTVVLRSVHFGCFFCDPKWIIIKIIALAQNHFLSLFNDLFRAP